LGLKKRFIYRKQSGFIGLKYKTRELKMKTRCMSRLLGFISALALPVALAAASGSEQWVEYDGFDGPGKGKHIVLVSGDEEYRSEQALTQFGKILAKRHGFRCTVLYPIDADHGGVINPEDVTNIPGLHQLEEADLMVIFTRFRRLPDEQMEHIDRYLKSGRPVLGLRTSTHGFQFPGDSRWAHYSNGYNGPKTEWQGGFGRLVLGEKWINHHGSHRNEATRGIIPEAVKSHPINRGVESGDIFGLTDVYGVRLPLPGDSKPLVLGQVVDGMKYGDPAVKGEKNDPMMPVAWTKSYQVPGGQKGKVFTTTLGASVDLQWFGTCQMLVNATYWCLGMEDRIPQYGTDARLVQPFDPTMYGRKPDEHWVEKGLRPADYKMDESDSR
jgi:type 1 glutamine amidotransferase